MVCVETVVVVPARESQVESRAQDKSMGNPWEWRVGSAACMVVIGSFLLTRAHVAKSRMLLVCDLVSPVRHVKDVSALLSIHL